MSAKDFAETLVDAAQAVGYFAGWFIGVLLLIGIAGLCLMTIPFAWHTLRANQEARKAPEVTPESPSIPPAAIKAMAARERISQAIDLGRKRRAWARDQDLEAEIHGMIGAVREGDRR